MFDTLEDTIADVTGEAGGEIGDDDAYPDAQGAGEGEHDGGDDEAADAEAGLGDVETEAEGHDGLVHHHGREDGQHVLFAALKTNGKTLAQSH